MGVTKVLAESQTPVSTERILNVIGKGDIEQIRDRDRRQFNFSPYEPTGLYASPNEKITIQVEGTQNIQAYIGAYGYDAGWREYGTKIKSFTLKPGENTIENPYGGMIYFYNSQQGGTVKAEIKAGGTPIPFFELGKHTKQDLVTMLDKYPNAHAVELKGERSLVTVSPERVKKYLLGSNTDPVELLKKIDESVRIQDKLAGLSEEQADKHYVAFAEDNHTPDYYMYANNFVTSYVGDAIQHVLNVKEFTENGWGPWHEMGHQRQQLPWKWDGLGEVTNNIYSMFSQRAWGNPSNLENDGRYESAFTYLNKPQSEKDYNKIDDVFIKLVMFWQLDLAFGEDFYPKLHQLYRAMPNEELPKTDDEQIQGFIYNTSKVAQKNLLPFFDKWGLKASPETRQKIEALNVQTLTAPIWEGTDSKPVQLNTLPKQNMKVIASSEELGVEPATNAIDGNPYTRWHSKWSEPNKYPSNLTIDLGETRTITQLSYLPRQDESSNGRILSYNIYTSTDGVNYQKGTSGTWENSKKQQFATFNAVTAKYVKLEVLNGVNGYASAGEIDILGY
ncbi:MULTISPECIES: M60 family metallopeptidase [unclassified Bacillus (in: firmicutes)]|uniref:M60 family metallopeptidase n=1 Tax=unclassified Bacillus (in: firmicutes) TaxID=185979 RepID=UPI0030FA7A5C